MKRVRVGILGATGAVGQTFVKLLDGHPWFDVAVLAASDRSAGKNYEDASDWIHSDAMPDFVVGKKVQGISTGLDCDLLFSAMSASVAGEIEADMARAGFPVISNARNYRMEDDVPLLIPEINPDHLDLIDRQEWSEKGFIVTNPNCSTMGLALALKPLHDDFGLESVIVTTMQAVSGAGYPGVPSLDILGSIFPFISGEEEKMASETLKILGTMGDGPVAPADFQVSAHCNRVPVVHGHFETVSVKFRQKADANDVRDSFINFRSPIADLDLPSSPDPVIKVFDNPKYPQSRKHVNLGKGMTVSVGRIRDDNVFDVKFVVLSHNTIRGAAGAAILNAELLVKQGRI